MYRVTFDDGSFAEVSSGHLWNVRGRRERRNGLLGWRTLSTLDLVEFGVKRPNGTAVTRQWEIPVQGEADFAEREIDIHPYLMGVWLGDGSKGAPIYTKPYAEIAEKIRSLGYDVSTYENGRNRIQHVADLFCGGVFDCGSHERYVPDDYKFNTAENRRALLEGVLDTDGEIGEQGSIGYSTTSRRLAEDIIWLARSLGCKAQMQDAVKKGWYPGCSGEKVECRECYRITLNMPWNPFTLQHRKERYKPCEHRYQVRWIDSIEPIGNTDGMCIQVANEDGLYLTNDFIVTHNSTLLVWLILWFILTRFPCKVGVIANSEKQLRDTIWPEIGIWAQRLPKVFYEQIVIEKERVFLKHAPDHSFATARTASKDNPDALQGLHADHMLLLLDEASGLSDAVFERGIGTLSTKGAKIVMAGNPTKLSGFFYRAFHGGAVGWATMRVNCEEVPRAQHHIEDVIATWGKESNAYRVRVLGEFPSSEDEQLIPTDLVESAVRRPVEETDVYRVVWGLDVARMGDDRSALCKRRGNALLEPVRWWRKKDTMQISGFIMNEWKEAPEERRPSEILVDVIGVGAGVVDRLSEQGLPVRGINVGERASVDDRFVRLRDELWWRAREWFDSKACTMPYDKDLIEELTAPSYTFTSKGQILVERKDDMKARGLTSPDLADSFVLTFAGGLDLIQKDERPKRYQPKGLAQTGLTWMSA